MPNIESLIAEVRARRDLPPPAMRRAIRQRAGLPLSRVADELHVSIQAVSHWELGHREPRPEDLLAYSELLQSLEEAAR
jgi:transcriptional regulator with XRE-family HTH domain